MVFATVLVAIAMAAAVVHAGVSEHISASMPDSVKAELDQHKVAESARNAKRVMPRSVPSAKDLVNAHLHRIQNPEDRKAEHDRVMAMIPKPEYEMRQLTLHETRTRPSHNSFHDGHYSHIGPKWPPNAVIDIAINSDDAGQHCELPGDAISKLFQDAADKWYDPTTSAPTFRFRVRNGDHTPSSFHFPRERDGVNEFYVSHAKLAPTTGVPGVNEPLAVVFLWDKDGVISEVDAVIYTHNSVKRRHAWTASRLRRVVTGLLGRAMGLDHSDHGGHVMHGAIYVGDDDKETKTEIMKGDRNGLRALYPLH